MNNSAKLPIVEIFESIEGEGTKAGYPTIFIRLFGCNLRCSWCDTPYSYPPSTPEKWLSISEIINEVKKYSAQHICLTGGEPLLYKDNVKMLLQELSNLSSIKDVHIETNGAIDLEDYINDLTNEKVRYIMDLKLNSSNEFAKMVMRNLEILRSQDEVKFVIASEDDFKQAHEILQKYSIKSVILMSPVWDSMPPAKLVELILAYRLSFVKLSLQLHKVIWDPNLKGV